MNKTFNCKNILALGILSTFLGAFLTFTITDSILMVLGVLAGKILSRRVMKMTSHRPITPNRCISDFANASSKFLAPLGTSDMPKTLSEIARNRREETCLS